MDLMRPALTLLVAPVLLLPILVASPAEAVGGTMPASQMLSQLVTATPSSATYDRAYFQHWIDADSNGCDTRQEVLIAESTTPVVKGSGCTIISGTWVSWYDGATWTDPADVDIDHMVPLAEAWKSGADQWTAAQRMAYANDLELPVALEAVTDNVNQSKSDKDPAAWLPPVAGVHCQYAIDWVQVKYRWNLAVDSSERTALANILTGVCGNTTVVVPAKADTTVPGAGVQRLSGADRYSTAVAISSQYAPGVPVVYVATGENYPDALSAAPAAAKLGGPLLLTPPSGLPPAVRAEIIRLNPALIVVVGSTGVMSDAMYSTLATLAPAIRRDGGTDRYDTSRIVIDRAFSTATKAYFATGWNFPDALSAGAAAGSSASPVFLIDGYAGSVPPATAALMTKLGVTTAVIAGGTAVITPQMEAALRAHPSITTVQRLAGEDRFSTSREINHAVFTAAPQAFFAVATGFADALAGAALAGRNAAPLYVVPGTCVPNQVIADLTAFGTTNRVLLGGPAALGSGVENLTPCTVATPPGPPQVSNPGDTKNCTDFSTWAAAQAWFDTYYPLYGDIARLDGNGDGIACESLPGAP
jgi:putative cell wall-binding protein